MRLKPFIEGGLFILLLSSSLAFAKGARIFDKSIDVTKAPPPAGLYTPGVGQPGALIAFGENILPKGDSKIGLFSGNYEGINSHYSNLTSSFLYGLTDTLSLELIVPFALSFQNNNHHSSGIEDSSAQLEYAVYAKSTLNYQEQATVVMNVSTPTGSTSKEPRTGNGTPTYFLGTTYNRTYENWFVFASPGLSFMSTQNGTNYGNKYFYQLGGGLNITEIGTHWIFAVVSELDGLYTEKTKISGTSSPNTGGNTIFLTPSLSLTGKRLCLQVGGGVPIVQNLNGHQNKTNYLLATNISWLL